VLLKTISDVHVICNCFKSLFPETLLVVFMQEFPLACVGAFVFNDKGEVLLVKSRKWFGKWGIPGGKIHYGEKMVDALKREVREEVGISVKDARPLALWDCVFSKQFFNKKAHFVFIDFACRISGRKQPKADGDELQECKWVSLEKALKMPLEPFARKAVKGMKEGKLGFKENFFK
jgi:8-oxo-dGTP pyrophosphatase MutT (NUDIX family)